MVAEAITAPMTKTTNLFGTTPSDVQKAFKSFDHRTSSPSPRVLLPPQQ
jgi:hypothetical protein